MGRGDQGRPRPGRAAVMAALLVALAGSCGGERGADEDTAATADTTTAEPDYESLSFPYELEAAQKRAVGRLLDQRPGWRLAVNSDNASDLLGRMKRDDPAYEPYLLEGDLDGDGQDDLVVALTNDSGTFRVIWFRRAGREYAPAQPVTNASDLEDGGLFLKDGDLLIGRFFSDVAQRYAWDAERRRLVRQPVGPELRS